MPTSYSLDLRERIVSAYENGEGSIRTLSKRFKVRKETVYEYIKQKRTQGHLNPKPHTGGRSTQKLFEAHFEAIEKWLEEEPSLLWSEVAELLQEEHQVQISPSQISRRMKARGWTRKKTPSSTSN